MEMSVMEPNLTQAAGSRVRMATLEQLKPLFALYLAPVPGGYTLRRWMYAARIPSMKANPRARNGGGLLYYRVDAVERWLRTRCGG
jgi:hypothetical protein